MNRPPEPTPKLKIGDVIIWRGWRDRGPTTDYVFDHVIKVTVEFERGGNRWEVYYRLAKDYGFRESELRQPVRSGHLNFVGSLASPGLHNDRLDTALRFHRDELKTAVDWFIAAGAPLHPRVGVLYPALRDVYYSRTWGSGHPSRLKRLTSEQAEVLEFTSSLPSPQRCLAFVGGWESFYHQRPNPNLKKAFDYNNYWAWGGVADFKLDAALRLLGQAADEEIIERVLAYRRRLLAGEAVYETAKTLEWLFPVDDSKATGVWPKPIMAWVKSNIEKPGSGKTRLNRVYEAATKAGEPMDNVYAGDVLRIWPDKKVLAVVAGKGGVGKSTVAADLARAVARTGRRVFLSDFDFHGPSQHKFFPLPEGGIRTEDGLMIPPQVAGVDVMSMGYLVGNGAAISHRGPFLASLIHLASLYTRVEADLVILDMPPGTGDVLRHVQDICPTAHYLFVATASDVATPDVQRAIAALTTGNRQRIVGVVDNMAYIGGDADRQPMWGSPEAVPNLAREHSLRYLGALPFYPWSAAGAEDARIAATGELLLPAMEQHVLGSETPYQDVADFEALVSAAASNLAEYIAARRFGSIAHTWAVDNIAGFLSRPIVEHGGNPDSEQYRETLVRELTGVWERDGNKVLSHTPAASLDGSRWWHRFAIEKGTEDAAG